MAVGGVKAGGCLCMNVCDWKSLNCDTCRARCKWAAALPWHKLRIRHVERGWDRVYLWTAMNRLLECLLA